MTSMWCSSGYQFGHDAWGASNEEWGEWGAAGKWQTVSGEWRGVRCRWSVVNFPSHGITTPLYTASHLRPRPHPPRMCCISCTRTDPVQDLHDLG